MFDESDAAVQEPSEPVQTRRRSRAVSFREADALTVAQLRTNQNAAANAAANATQAPTSSEIAIRPSIFSEKVYIPSLPMAPQRVPKPGPAKLKTSASIPEMLAKALQNKWLPEWTMKFLCEESKKVMMEGRIEYFPITTKLTC